jgi:hypothetical protein
MESTTRKIYFFSNRPAVHKVFRNSLIFFFFSGEVREGSETKKKKRQGQEDQKLILVRERRIRKDVPP